MTAPLPLLLQGVVPPVAVPRTPHDQGEGPAPRRGITQLTPSGQYAVVPPHHGNGLTRPPNAVESGRAAAGQQAGGRL